LYLGIQRKQIAVLLLIAAIAYSGYGFACSSNDVHKVKVKVDQAASILNTAAKSNRELYRSAVYGAVGSPGAIATRQKVATGVHEANEYLSEAVEVAAQLQPGMSGQAVIDLLTKAAQQLVHTRVGNDRIDILIQSAVTAINSAILIAQTMKVK
jgi:hypothetical protein